MKKLIALLALLLAAALPVNAQFSRITSVTLQNSNSTQAAFYTSPFTVKLGANCTWSISGTTATLNCSGGAASSVPFSGITSGTNSTASMIVGTGASLSLSGAGTVTANRTTGLTDQEVLYNNSNAIAAISGLINGPANCDGFGTPCKMKATLASGTYSLLSTITGAPAGNYTGMGGSTAGGFVRNQMDAWDGTNYSLFVVSSNPALGVFGSPVISSQIFKTCASAGCAEDYADAGQIRSANNQNWCAEANPTGTDVCITLGDTGNNILTPGANGFSSRQLTSTVATGTAPLVVASTTLVTNLHAATADASTTVTGLTPTSCTNQFVTAISASGSGTCTTDTLASAQHANQGTTTTLLHGNGAGNPSFTAVVSADLSLTATTCTNQFVTAISATAVGTCTTDTLASAQHANQGTTTTVLHGNAAGNPSFAAVALATDVSGQLPIAAVGSAGLSATSPLAIAATGAMTCTTCTTTIASGTLALATGAITSGTCTTAQTATATGTATTDTVMADFNADPTAVTGYTPAITGMLTIIKYPTTNTFNVKVCNLTASSITPGAITLNFRVVR